MLSTRRPADLPIVEDDAFLEEALRSANVPTLMMSLVHMTGGMEVLRGLGRPAGAIIHGAQSALTAAEKAEIRARALEVLKAYRDGGCRLPPQPDAATLHEMMSLMVGQEVPEAYVPLMMEELSLDGEDARDTHWQADLAGREDFAVLVIGAGMSGVLSAIRLGQAGIPYTVVEKNPGIGGTWYENTYPGCRVDVGNHFYCYSFEPNPDWSEYFSQQAELRRYFEGCAEKYGVLPHVRFETEVTALRFDEASARWEARLRTSDGREETLTFSAVISAVGQLNRPRIPELEGLASFRGVSFHSARWNHDVDLAGKRVAVIGSGASAFQIVPEVAKVAGKLTVFQRSPAWMTPNPKYHRQVSQGKKWLLRHVPYYARWYRFLIFWPGSDGLWPSLVVDPDWPHPDRSINAANEAMRERFTAYIEAQVGDDPELLAKVVPSYPPFGKRMLQDDGSWLAALKRPNVELVTDGIEKLTEAGIVGRDGRLHELDVIVFATGFHANRFLWPIEVIGRDGLKLRELWGDDPAAYLGITVPGFPNLFCLYGPATNLAHAGSIIFHSECQVRYVMGCLRALLEGGHTTLECRQEVHDAFDERLREALSRMVWEHPGMSSWYKNSQGRVTTTSPWLLLDYWRWTREPDLRDYRLT